MISQKVMRENILPKKDYLTFSFEFPAVFSLLYYYTFFKSINGFSKFKSILTFLIILLVSVSIITFLNYKSRRNFISIAFSSVIPFEIYTLLSSFRRMPKLYTVTLILFLILSILYAVLVLSKKIKNKKYKTKIILLRIKYAILGSTTIFAIIYFVVTPIVCFTTTFGYVDYSEWTIENKIEIISMLDEKTWKTLDESEKLNVLETIKNIEMNRLGITHSVNLVSKDLRIELCGEYSYLTGNININKKRLSQNPPEELVNTILHESYHVYQQMCIDLYNSVKKKYKKLDLFYEAELFKINLSEYISAEDNYDGYFMQYMEFTSREYAANRTSAYFK